MLNLDSSYWTKIYTVNLEAKTALKGKHDPIPDLRVPVPLDSHTLLVGASSFKTKPTWKLGFWLSMYFKISGIGQPTFPQVSIPLGLLYVQFPKLTTSYNLIAKIPYWHSQMRIDIWKYRGPSEPVSLATLEKQLAQIKQQVGMNTPSTAQLTNTQVILPGQIPGIY